jgi:hypothetical protein
MGTNANVIIEKPQGIFYEAVGTALPTVTGTLGSDITMTGWNDIGFIDPEGKIKIGFSANVRRIRPMGMEGNLKGIAAQKMATIEFSGLEDVIEMLEIALGGSTLAANVMPDGGDGEMNYIALAIVTTNVVYHFKKVAANHELAKEIGDTEESRTPFVLETYIEEAATAGERQWKILERT